MREMGERIAGTVLAVIGIVAMVAAFGGGAAHAAPGIDQSAVGTLAQEESSAPDSSDSGAADSDSSDSSNSDSSDSSDDTDSSTEDATDESDSPTPVPTETPFTMDTPSDLPTETAGGTTDEGGASPLGWLLLGGGAIAAVAAFAVYRRGV